MSKANEKFDKETYLLTEIGCLDSSQRIVKSLLSDALQNVTKQDMDQFKDPKYSFHRFALRSDLLHLVACCEKQLEYEEADDKAGVRREVERQEEMKKRVRLEFDSIKQTEGMIKPTFLRNLFSSFIDRFY